MEAENIRLCVFGAACLTGALLSAYQTRASYRSELLYLKEKGEIDEEPTLWNAVRLFRNYRRTLPQDE